MVNLPYQSSDAYPKTGLIGTGTYGSVYSSTDTQGNNYALKKFKYADIESTVRELAILKYLQGNPNIVDMKDIFVSNDNIYLVMPLAQGTVYDQIKSNVSYDVKNYAYQIICGLAYCHSKNIIHRDIKLDNILIFGDTLKIADFGLSRVAPCGPGSMMSTRVYTRFYRPPEVILNGEYNDRSDVWAYACVFCELLMRGTMFPGPSDEEQLETIFKTLGSPIDYGDPEYLVWPNRKNSPMWFDSGIQHPGEINFSEYNHDLADLLKKMLTYDNKRRISAFQIQNHIYFEGYPQNFTFSKCIDRNSDVALIYPGPGIKDSLQANFKYEHMYNNMSYKVLYDALFFADKLNVTDEKKLNLCFQIARKMDGGPDFKSPQILRVIGELDFDLIVLNPWDILRRVRQYMRKDIHKAAVDILYRVMFDKKGFRHRYDPYVIAQGCLELAHKGKWNMGITKIEKSESEAFLDSVDRFKKEYSAGI